jgi:hypothetical protein
MKLANSTILAIAVTAVFSFTAYVMGQGQPTLTNGGQAGTAPTLQGGQAGPQGQLGQTAQGSAMSKPQMSASPGGSVTPQEPKASKMSKPQMSASPGGSVTPQEPKPSGP